MYYYKARIYSPTLGRFLQTDPIGYEDQYNLYAYVGNDPINAVDPTGMCTGSRITNEDGTCASTGGFTTGIQGAAQGMQFTSAVRKAVDEHLSMAAEGTCTGDRCPEDFAELSEEDMKLAAEIRDTPSVKRAMVRSWEKTLRSGREHGFWIYRANDGSGFFPGKEKVGTSTAINLGRPLTAIRQKREFGRIGLAEAKFHTHPGSYPNAGRPSRGDLRGPTYLKFIYTYRGLIYGRHAKR